MLSIGGGGLLNAAACVITGLGQILHNLTALDWRPWPGALQSCHDIQVSERQHTTVSVGALHLSIQRWHALASVFCVSGSTLMAIRHSHLLARWPGILSQILFRMPRTALTVFGIYLKCTCSHDTSILGVLNDNALYKSKRSLTHCNLGFMVILLHQHEFQLSSTDRQLKHRLQIKMTHTADSYLLSDYSCTIQQQKWYDKDQQRHSRWFVWLLPQSVWRQSRRQ